MAPAIRDANQADLLAWEAPSPVDKFDPLRVRAATLAGKIKRAISETLKDEAEKGWDRESTAGAMSQYLGEPVSKNALDSWCSEAREDHMPSLVRFIGLLDATGDKRLLQVIAAQLGWAVIDKKWLPMIELASLREHEDKVRDRRRALQAHARIAGTL
jgi:hypothetical protein